jgi:hypothetical protein
MKFTATLCFFAVSSCVIAAPIPKAMGRFLDPANLSNASPQQDHRIKLPTKSSIQPSNKVSGKKGSNARETGPANDQHHDQHHAPLHVIVSPSSSKGPSRKPKSSSLTSLAHRLVNKSPFSDSSIVREETRASREDWEPEATIVEWETKASREAYIWIPCLSSDKTLRYHRIRVNTDMLVVSLVLCLAAIILVIELWKPIAGRLHRFRYGHGPIYLDTLQAASKETSNQKQCLSYGPMLESGIQSKQKADNTEGATTK